MPRLKRGLRSVYRGGVFRTCLAAGAGLLLATCTSLEPEVVVVNLTAERIMLRNPSFSGAAWDVVLRYGEATPPQRCLAGSDRVHFQKFDPYGYCRTQLEYGLADPLCPCDTSRTETDTDSTIITPTPIWYNYQTTSIYAADRGDFLVFEIRLADMEQDFSVPGPYGH